MRLFEQIRGEYEHGVGSDKGKWRRSSEYTVGWWRQALESAVPAGCRKHVLRSVRVLKLEEVREFIDAVR